MKQFSGSFLSFLGAVPQSVLESASEKNAPRATTPRFEQTAQKESQQASPQRKRSEQLVGR